MMLIVIFFPRVIVFFLFLFFAFRKEVKVQPSEIRQSDSLGQKIKMTEINTGISASSLHLHWEYGMKERGKKGYNNDV